MTDSPILDPLLDLIPEPLRNRHAYVQPGALSTVRFPGDVLRTDADRWFATSSRSRPVRSGNQVMYLVDGAATFAEMARVMRTAVDAKEHFIYIIGWQLRLEFPFDGSGATAADVLREADGRGIQVRALIWSGTHEVGAHPAAAIITINALRNGQAYADPRTLSDGSHHQKIVIVNGSEGLFGFCGGIDIDPTRAFANGVHGSDFAGAPFHDVHCRVSGPAAWDLLSIFRERWHDFVRANAGNCDVAAERGTLLGDGISLEAQPRLGRLKVRVATTYGNGMRHGGLSSWAAGATDLQRSPYDFARPGDTTAADMFFCAIEASRRFIYIEDQYFVHIEAADALARALVRLQHLTIVLPHSDLTDLPHVWEHRKAAIDRLRAAGGSKVRVFVRFPYGPFVPHSYVHAKTWIFDDEFAIIGTANVNRRSWTHDSEVVVGVYDESRNDAAAYRFAHRLRMRLWSEHLNMDDPAGLAQLADGVASIVHWDLRAAPESNVKAYDVNEKVDPFTLWPWDNVDPEGR